MSLFGRLRGVSIRRVKIILFPSIAKKFSPPLSPTTNYTPTTGPGLSSLVFPSLKKKIKITKHLDIPLPLLRLKYNTKTNSTSHKWLVHWRVPGQAERAWERRRTGSTPENPCALRGRTAAWRRAGRAWRPVSVFQARPPVVSWLWLFCSETKFWPESPSDWESWRTRLSRRWRGTASGGTCAPAPAAAR